MYIHYLHMINVGIFTCHVPASNEYHVTGTTFTLQHSAPQLSCGRIRGSTGLVALHCLPCFELAKGSMEIHGLPHVTAGGDT